MRARSWFLVTIMLVTQASFAQFKLYEKGHESYKAGKYDEAITFFSDFLSKPTHDKALDVEVYYVRALSYYKKNNFQSALNDFQESALLNHPNRGNIYWFMAKCNFNLGAYAESVENYNSALQDLTGADAQSKLLQERSAVHAKLGNTALAQQDINKAFTLNPSNAEIKKEHDKLNQQEVVSRNTETNKPVDTKSNAKKPGANTKKDDRKQTPANDVKTDVAKTDVPTQKQEVAKETVTPTVPAEPTLAELYQDEKRYALVIGNSEYPKNIGVLKNPVNDASDIADELRKSNFEVQLLTNATYGQIRVAMLKFKEKVDAGQKDKTVALFYYAGHGLQFEDENYIVPVDASVEFEDDIPRYCFPIQRMVLANMERSNSRMNIVILDACRNNPFPAVNRSLGQQGLGEMRRARGSFIAYATAPGSVASDGTGRNGLYTQELLKAMRKPGRTIEQVFKEVRSNVLKLSNDRQNTWDSSNIIGEFYFKY